MFKSVFLCLLLLLLALLALALLRAALSSPCLLGPGLQLGDHLCYVDHDVVTRFELVLTETAVFLLQLYSDPALELNVSVPLPRMHLVLYIDVDASSSQYISDLRTRRILHCLLCSDPTTFCQLLLAVDVHRVDADEPLLVCGVGG